MSHMDIIITNFLFNQGFGFLDSLSTFFLCNRVFMCTKMNCGSTHIYLLVNNIIHSSLTSIDTGRYLQKNLAKDGIKIKSFLKRTLGWKHTMVIPFGASHCTAFQGCACLNVSHLKLLKDFHNIFAYYVRI